jgi:hypothetical protein
MFEASLEAAGKSSVPKSATIEAKTAWVVQHVVMDLLHGDPPLPRILAPRSAEDVLSTLLHADRKVLVVADPVVKAAICSAFAYRTPPGENAQSFLALHEDHFFTMNLTRNMTQALSPTERENFPIDYTVFMYTTATTTHWCAVAMATSIPCSVDEQYRFSFALSLLLGRREPPKQMYLRLCYLGILSTSLESLGPAELRRLEESTLQFGIEYSMEPNVDPGKTATKTWGVADMGVEHLRALHTSAPTCGRHVQLALDNAIKTGCTAVMVAHTLHKKRLIQEACTALLSDWTIGQAPESFYEQFGITQQERRLVDETVILNHKKSTKMVRSSFAILVFCDTPTVSGSLAEELKFTSAVSKMNGYHPSSSGEGRLVLHKFAGTLAALGFLPAYAERTPSASPITKAVDAPSFAPAPDAESVLQQGIHAAPLQTVESAQSAGSHTQPTPASRSRGPRVSAEAAERADAAMAALLLEESQQPAAASMSKKAKKKARKQKKAAACDSGDQRNIDLSTGSVTAPEAPPSVGTILADTTGTVQAASEAPLAAPSSSEPREPPDEFACPITHELMDDPVMASDGHTYERRAIERWLETKKTSPKSGLPLESVAVFPNHLVRRLIREWQEAPQG